jgi:hypothetical protein
METSEQDWKRADQVQADICYGELLPDGINKLFSKQYLDIENATMVYDLVNKQTKH